MRSLTLPRLYSSEYLKSALPICNLTRHDRMMWKHILQSCFRGPRVPEIDISPNNVTVTEEEPRLINPKLFPEGICTTCQGFTLHNLLQTENDPERLFWVSYDRNMLTDCPMCNMIFGTLNSENLLTGNIDIGWALEYIKPETDTGSEIQVCGVYRQRQRGIGSTRVFLGPTWLRVYADRGSYASKFVPAVRAPSSNLSAATFQTICRRIQECDETHMNCWSHSSQFSEAEMRYLPTRVVHVGSATRQPHLYISQTHQSNRYIALSHCWGKTPQVRTLNENIELFREEIILGSLSKTFQDAIHVARRLGIEYIWIDSLCIIQDDKTDWLQESERMGDVYANAYVTIAATWASDGNDGLDSVRPQCNWFKFPFDGSDEGDGYMWFTDGSWKTETDLDDAPLNTRGWVFQEKLLSQRIIHYAASQVYWECKEYLLGEERENGNRFHGKPLEPSRFWTSVNAVSHIGAIPIERNNDAHEEEDSQSKLREFYGSWRTFLRYYCTRDLTKESDRLIALLGIIRVVERQTGLRCVEGHWDDGSWTFVRELMWLPKEQVRLSVLDDGRQARLCSSWSWASLRGPKEPELTGRDFATWKEYGLKDCNLHLEAIEDEVQIPWPCHPLRVSGMLKTFHKCEPEGIRVQNETQGRKSFVIKAELSGIADGWVCFDRDDEEPEEFHFCPVYVWNWRIACLALVQRHEPEGRDRCFERVGAGYVCPSGSEHDSMESFESCERSTFHII